MKKYLILLICLLIFLVSCKKPEYPKPQVYVPDSYRGAEGGQNDKAAAGQSLGDLFWWDFLKDDVLKDYLRSALAVNYDTRLAAENIIQARANVSIARAQQLPFISGEVTYTAGKAAPNPPQVNTQTIKSYGVSFPTTYEVDFWGALHNATAAAQANLLSTVEGQNIVYITLVSEVASSYLTLRELDWELEISQKTLDDRKKSYELVKSRLEGGVSNMMEVEQAKGLYLEAQSAITSTQQQIGQQEDFLSFLLSKNPGDIKRGLPLIDQLPELAVPAGLPSDLLLNRPDIRQAEDELIAANAQIDVARKAFFPRFFITGAAGSSSAGFANIFASGSTWSVSPQLELPIFTGGQLRNQLRLTQSQQRQLVINYEATVQNAFREVSDSLIGYNKSRLFRQQQEELTASLADQSELSNMRYQGGVTSYLEVLDTEKDYFSGELQLARVKLNELLYLIQLYKALGGGWRQN